MVRCAGPHCTCAGADGFFADNVSKQVVLVKPRAVLCHGDGPLVSLRPQVDHLVVGVSIWSWGGEGEKNRLAATFYISDLIKNNFNFRSISFLWGAHASVSLHLFERFSEPLFTYVYRELFNSEQRINSLSYSQTQKWRGTWRPRNFNWIDLRFSISIEKMYCITGARRQQCVNVLRLASSGKKLEKKMTSLKKIYHYIFCYYYYFIAFHIPRCPSFHKSLNSH